MGAEPALVLGLRGRPNWQLVSPGPAQKRLLNPTDWRLRVDPENVGWTEGWPERGLPPDTLSVEVPGVWNTAVPGYTGVGWYEARFPGPFQPGGTVRLVVGGANYLTEAWLNGVYLGRHEGGYDAFSFRCGHALRAGDNRLTLRIVDPPADGEVNGLRLRECPTGKESWYGGYGGPWGGVWLEQSARVWIEDVRVYGDLLGKRATFQITLASDLPELAEVTIRALAHEEEMDSRVAGSAPSAMATLAVGRSGVTVSLSVDVVTPRPWSPESPALYTWAVSVDLAGDDTGGDAATGTLGFRTCELRDGTFYLNGEPLYLKGALLQPTYPRSLVLPPNEVVSHDVELARAAGINLLRCHLRPPPFPLLDLADRWGMLCYVEPPLAWIEPSPRLLEHGKRELAAMVRACANHPSVVLWGIFNENARSAEAVGGDLLAELAALDPTRPIVENSGGAAVGEVGMWAWGGQSRCWSPGWEAPRPLNDVHIYLSSPLRSEARQILETVGEGTVLDVTPGRSPDERIESRLASDGVLVSEYGAGGLPDFDAALASFGDERRLSDAQLLQSFRDDLERGLAERGLDREIGDVPTVVAATQALQAEGVLAQTAALRCNPRVTGYVLTQLADASWEQLAGLVGLWRHPRPALEAFARANRPRLLYVEPIDPCSTGPVQLRAWLLQDPGLAPPAETGRLRVTVAALTPQPALPQAGERESWPPSRGEPLARPHGVLPPLDAGRPGGRGPAHMGTARLGTGTTDLGALAIELPPEPGHYVVRASLATGDWQDTATCVVRRLPDVPSAPSDGFVVLGDGPGRTLPGARPDLPPDWRGPILASLAGDDGSGGGRQPTTIMLAQAAERARAGAHLCLLGIDPGVAARLGRILRIPLTAHGARGNFMGVFHYLRGHPLFAGLDVPSLADSAFAEVLPAWALEEIPGAEVLAGCFSLPDGGPGFRWRATVQTLAYGAGRLTFWQLLAGIGAGGGAGSGGALGDYLLRSLVSWLSRVGNTRDG